MTSTPIIGLVNQSVLVTSVNALLLIVMLSAAAVTNQGMKQIPLSGHKVTMMKDILIVKDHRLWIDSKTKFDPMGIK